MGSADVPNRCGVIASDRLGEFGERRGVPQSGRGVDGEFVVSAAEGATAKREQPEGSESANDHWRETTWNGRPGATTSTG